MRGRGRWMQRLWDGTGKLTASVTVASSQSRRSDGLFRSPSDGSCIRTLDYLSDQLLSRLAGMAVANELVRRRGIQQSRLACVASGKRIRSSQLERAEHVADHGSEGRCWSTHGLVKKHSCFGDRRVRVVERV